MSHSFGADLGWRVITAISGGLSTRKAARRFSIGVSTAGEWYRRYCYLLSELMSPDPRAFLVNPESLSSFLLMPL